MGTLRPVPPAVRCFDDRFSFNLAAARHAKGWSRQILADLCGLTPRIIEQIETGAGTGTKRRATIGEALVLSHALGVKTADLLKAVGDA